MVKDSKGKKKVAITTDERFSGIHNDPRFNLPKRNDFKVEIDGRFKKSDLESIKKKSKVDKYGRKVKEGDSSKAFNKYYKTNEDKKKQEESEEQEPSTEEEEPQPQPQPQSESESESEPESEAGLAEGPSVGELEKQIGLDLARGEGLPSDYESSSDESSSDEESSADESDDDDDDEEEGQDEKLEEGEPTSRIAVVNLDWDHVKSTDLMATLNSFAPKIGYIKEVAIYPSEFGKERLQREDLEGPPKEIFKSKKSKKSEAGDSDSDSDSELEAKDLYEEGNADVDYDNKSLRRYQLQRLRYYYAIVSCDSVTTAESVYKSCNGTEYESSANMFELRYVPEDMEFDEEPRDSCTKVPSNYKPHSFVTDALQHSKVKLTWDETPVERMKLSSKAFSQRDIEDMDLNAYLASDNSDDETEDLKNKYKNLLGASTKIGNKDIFSKNDDNDDDVDMEITFTPGLDEKSTVNVEGTGEGEEESTLDKLKRKAKERRKSRKDRVKELKKEELERKKVEKSEPQKKTKKQSSKDVDGKSKAELELLMLDEKDGANQEHFSLKELVKSEKEKSKKSKHRNKDKIIEDDFKADLNDPRFNEIFTNHDFAIDPSQPQFKKTSTMAKILEERNKRRDGDEKLSSKNKQSKKRKRTDTAITDSGDVNSLVQRIKRKSKKND